MFENVTWPIACVFNTKVAGGAKSTGKAEVELIKSPTKNKLLDRKDKRHKQSLVDYAEDALNRVSTS